MRNILANEELLRHIEWTNAVSLIVVTLGAWALFSAKMAFGVLLGWVVTTLSFQVLKRQLQRAFQNPKQIPSKGGLFVGYYLRFLATLFVVYTVIYYDWANPIAFVVGLSLVVLSIALVGVHEFLMMLVKKGGR